MALSQPGFKEFAGASWLTRQRLDVPSEHRNRVTTYQSPTALDRRCQRQCLGDELTRGRDVASVRMADCEAAQRRCSDLRQPGLIGRSEGLFLIRASLPAANRVGEEAREL